jgi:hypothetical protein
MITDIYKLYYNFLYSGIIAFATAVYLLLLLIIYLIKILLFWENSN